VTGCTVIKEEKRCPCKWVGRYFYRKLRYEFKKNMHGYSSCRFILQSAIKSRIFI